MGNLMSRSFGVVCEVFYCVLRGDGSMIESVGCERISEGGNVQFELGVVGLCWLKSGDMMR
jgi:hypothetical protein